jgi:dihydroorotase
MDRLSIIRPDDWHLHVREGDMLRTVLMASASVFGRAIIMPNLKNPVTTAARAAVYREEIIAALTAGTSFTPLMTCYLTDQTDPDDLANGHRDGIFIAAKLYPAHATTNSEHGVTELRRIYPVLERMQKIGMPLLVHGEVTDAAIDIFDREKVFLDRVLTGLLQDFPELKIVLEHATTKDAVDFVSAHAASGRLAATITAHHLHIDRNAMLVGGIRPHFYCLPVAKRATHKLALIAAATSGASCFFLGTDSAPHPRALKETACGCAGIFTAPTALPLYAEIFDRAGQLDRLEAFASRYGALFYGLPVNAGNVTLRKSSKALPTLSCLGGDAVTPFAPPEPLHWEIAPA